MKRLLCWLRLHDWRSQYRERDHYIEYHYRNGGKGYIFGPARLGDKCARCGKRRPPFEWYLC